MTGTPISLFISLWEDDPWDLVFYKHLLVYTYIAEGICPRLTTPLMPWTPLS